MRRSAGAIAVLAIMLTLARAAPASAEAYAEWSLVERANRERVDRGLGALHVSYDLVAAARRHSARMRDAATAYHDPALGQELCCWEWIGENVGVGSDVGKIHDAFMRSSSHRAVLLDPRWNEIGVGFVIEDHRRIWVSQIFVHRVRPAAPRVVAAHQAPEPAPLPAREPAQRPGPLRLRSVDLLIRMLGEA